MSTKSLDRHFGVIAVEKEFITTDQFIDAMKIQILEDMEGSKRNLIGTILVEMGAMNISRVDEVLKFIDMPI